MRRSNQPKPLTEKERELLQTTGRFVDFNCPDLSPATRRIVISKLFDVMRFTVQDKKKPRGRISRRARVRPADRPREDPE
jgi:hypothetical protein